MARAAAKPPRSKQSTAWVLLPGALRREREQKGLSPASLAHLAHVAEKTIRRLEKGGQSTVRFETLHAIAVALGCDIARLGQRHEPRRPGWQPAADNRIGMDSLIAQGIVVPRGRPAMLAKRADEPPAALSEQVLEHVAVAFRAHEGKRFAVTGRIQSQAALTDLERFALGCRRGVGARFTIANAPIYGGSPVTLYARALESTDALQSALSLAAPIAVVARLTVVETSHEHPTVSDSEPLATPRSFHGWRGFTHEGADTLLPWALVVEP